MDEIGAFFIEKATTNGIERAVAETIFSYMMGYASYGFCEAHAAAFASTAFKTAYLVRHHPAEFFAAILSQQPMGYYPPHVIANEAVARGIAMLPLDINQSGRDFAVADVPPGLAVRPSGATCGIRIALKQLKGLPETTLTAILDARTEGPFASLGDFCARVAISREVLENLIAAGAFDQVAPNRRLAMWQSRQLLQEGRSLRGNRLGLTAGGGAGAGAGVASSMADFTVREKFIREYDLLGINAGRHFMEFFRPNLKARGFLDSAEARAAAPGDPVEVAGVVIRPHRPPTKSGRIVVFLSLEDECGLIDVTVFERVYDRYGKFIFADPTPPLKVAGRIERRGQGVSVIANRIAPLTAGDG
jgi:error-prone DNA polymerase